MPTNTVIDVLSDLQKFYNKKLTGTQIKFYVDQLNKMNEDDLCKGAISLKRKETIFPVIATIERYVFDAREFRLQREKEQAPTFEHLKDNAVTPNGLDTIAMMRDLYEGRINREQYLERMSKMEQKYPGIGWKKNYEELKHFWATELQRHEKGWRYLERIWNVQDQDPKFKAYNDPRIKK